ncbi:MULTISPECIES: hypothetical protein [Maribacter]|uniref:DUF4252 domain-containing protein n=2 Tax=Maribacter TaxID=252356 RepID=A0A5R8MA29_9FLAO|nr:MULTISPECIES: hypothetical protein [Maribacter]MDC6404059.1 hypothetical protein [Maribacter sp. PR66]MEE1971200.1 hypothetical protein [Maribacter flavus]TLF46360.1 hypothetical protein FEK29_00855 [Maribacter aurantiacus]
MQKLALLMVVLLMYSCMSSQKSEKSKGSGTIESTKIKALINPERFGKIENANTVIRIDLVKTLIEGTENEYYNQLKVLDTLNVNSAQELKQVLIDDTNYVWDLQNSNSSFDPQQQFILKNNDEQLTILLDENENKIAFMDLFGRKVISVTSGFPFFRKNLSDKK